jgi:hypothetical protein
VLCAKPKFLMAQNSVKACIKRIEKIVLCCKFMLYVMRCTF